MAVSSLVANLGSRRRPTHLVRYPERTSRVHTVVSRTRRPTRVVPFPLPRGHHAHLAATTQLSQFRMRTNANPFQPSPPTPSTSVPPHPTLVIGVDVVLGRRSIRRRGANSLRHSHRSPARRRPAHTVPRIVRTIATHPFALDSIPHRGRRRRRHHRRARPHRRNGFSPRRHNSLLPFPVKVSVRPRRAVPSTRTFARVDRNAREKNRAVLRRRVFRSAASSDALALLASSTQKCTFSAKQENASNVNLKQSTNEPLFTRVRERRRRRRQMADGSRRRVGGKVFALSRRFARLVDKGPAGWCAS